MSFPQQQIKQIKGSSTLRPNCLRQLLLSAKRYTQSPLEHHLRSPMKKAVKIKMYTFSQAIPKGSLLKDQ